MGREVGVAEDLPQTFHQLVAPVVEPLVHAGLRQLVEGGVRGGDGDDVGRVGTRHGHDAAGDQVHDVLAAAERRDGEAATQALGEDGQVRLDAELALRAGQADAETGDHLVEHQHAAVLVAEFAHALEIAWQGQDAAGIGHDRLGQHARDVVALALQGLPQDVEVVPRQDDEVLVDALGHARSLGHRDRRAVRPGLVDVRVLGPVNAIGEAVIHAFEPDHLLAAGEGAGEAQGIDDSLRARVAQAHLLHARNGGDDLVGEGGLVLMRQGEHRAAVLDRVDDGLGDPGRAVAEDHRPEAQQVVDVAIAVTVDHMGAFPVVDEQGVRVPAGPDRARGGIHAAGDHLAGAGETFGAGLVTVGLAVGFRHAVVLVRLRRGYDAART